VPLACTVLVFSQSIKATKEKRAVEIRVAEDFQKALLPWGTRRFFTLNNSFHKSLFLENKNASCCCDECCGMVEKCKKLKPAWIFAKWCTVDFFAFVRKSPSLFNKEPGRINSSTKHPHHSHVFPTNSPHAFWVANFPKSGVQ